MLCRDRLFNLKSDIEIAPVRVDIPLLEELHRIIAAVKKDEGLLGGDDSAFDLGLGTVEVGGSFRGKGQYDKALEHPGYGLGVSLLLLTSTLSRGSPTLYLGGSGAGKGIAGAF